MWPWQFQPHSLKILLKSKRKSTADENLPKFGKRLLWYKMHFQLFNQHQLVFCNTKLIFKLWNYIHPGPIFCNTIISEITKFFLVRFQIKTINWQILQPITYWRKSISLWNTCCSSKRHCFHIVQLHSYIAQLHRNIVWIALPYCLDETKFSITLCIIQQKRKKNGFSHKIFDLKVMDPDSHWFSQINPYYNIEAFQI